MLLFYSALCEEVTDARHLSSSHLPLHTSWRLFSDVCFLWWQCYFSSPTFLLLFSTSHLSLKCDDTTELHLPGKGDWETLPCLKKLIIIKVPFQLELLLRKLFNDFKWVSTSCFSRMYVSIAVLYCCKSCLFQLLRKSENWMQSLNSVLKLCLLFSVMNAVRVSFVWIYAEICIEASHTGLPLWAEQTKRHSSCPLQAEVRWIMPCPSSWK